MGKDRRGEKTPYIGNAKPFGGRGRDVSAAEATGKRVTNETQADDHCEDIPF
jgi:hypothetical protein